MLCCDWLAEYDLIWFFTDLERLSKLSTEQRRQNYFCDEKDCRNVADIPTWQEQYKKHHKTLSEKGKNSEYHKIMGDYVLS